MKSFLGGRRFRNSRRRINIWRTLTSARKLGFHARQRLRALRSHGRAYLDFLGGIAVNALGYAHPRLVRTIRREAGRATHVSNLFHNPFQGPLAKKIG